MGKRLDLTGQRFGMLTVLCRGKNADICTTWVCKCDCGQETVVRTSNLRNGRSKSCGCQHHAKITEINKKRKNNTSSVIGVEWMPHKKRWKATICISRERFFLGEYDDFEDAVEARKNAEKARKRAEENLRDNFLREFAIEQVQSAGG